MQSFFRLSAGLAAVGVLLWGAASLQAMEVTSPDADVGVNLYGFASGAFFYYSPATQETAAGGDQPPARFTTASEGRIGLDIGSDQFTGHVSRWWRRDSAVGPLDQDHANVTWRPTPELSIVAGRLQTAAWSKRAAYYDNYWGWSPSIRSANYYTAYVETDDGIDFTYDVGGIQVGLMYNTNGDVTGTPTGAATIGVTAADASANTITPHFRMMTGPMTIIVSHAMETVVASADAWETDSGNLTSSQSHVYVDFAYDDAGSAVRLDFVQRTIGKEFQDDAGEEDEVMTAIGFSLTHMLGGNKVVADVYSDTIADDDAADDVTRTSARVAYGMDMGNGAAVAIDLFTDSIDAGGNSEAQDSNGLGISLFQAY